ncbi:MAG: acyltransferase [Litoreibacter sp.]|nr:acyltransferase [Litoreibacter sp.]
MSLLSQARAAARQTPASRNRAADFYRTAAICFVVLGHWFLVAPYAPEGQLELRNILAELPWTQYLTLIFQVMPVFFFVGGYSNAASWTSARRSPEKRNIWAAGRLRRLLVPVVPLVILWAIAATIAYQLETDSELVANASRAALIPVWFLAVYLMVTLVVPISYAFWERFGLWSVMALAALAILVDLIGVGLGQSWLRWVNYAPVWLAAHQLGYWWWRGDIGGRGIALLIATGLVWMSILLGPAGYPLSMVSVPGEAFSNTRPPTTAMLALGSIQISLMLLLARPLSVWLQRETPWALVILAGQSIMTLYLWHLTVVIVLVGLSLALGGLGLAIEPGTGAWWAFRPVWMATLILGLLPFMAIFSRFEAGSRAASDRPVGFAQAGIGAVTTCMGLSMLALLGIGWDGLPGFNWIAVFLILAGVTMATRGRKHPPDT